MKDNFIIFLSVTLLKYTFTKWLPDQHWCPNGDLGRYAQRRRKLVPT